MRTDRAFLIMLVLVGCEACAREAAVPPPVLPEAPAVQGAREDDPAPAHPPAEADRAVPAALVTRAELAAMDRQGCERMLRAHDVAFERVAESEAPGVHAPIRLTGPIGGVTVTFGGRDDVHEIMDCRLAISLLGFAPMLRAAGFDHIEHMSIYRPGARVRSTGRLSGHDGAVAIDVFYFIRPDGTRLSVEDDWVDKTIGAPVCPPRDDEPEGQHVLRTLVCDAVAADLFQVVVTPHGNARHHNHVHLEIRPEVDWTHLR